MNKNRFVLDTNAVIFLTARGSTIPSELLNELDEAELFISVITEIELFAKPSMLLDEEEKLQSFISDRISVIELTGDIKKEAISIRRAKSLKLPDSIIAAASIVLDALLLTDDEHLLNLSWPGFRKQSISCLPSGRIC